MKTIVNDYVYVEYGFKSEIVTEAVTLYKVYDDISFQDIIELLEEFHGVNHSFLNI